MRRRNELRDEAIAVNAGFNGGEAIDKVLPEAKMVKLLTQEGFETEKWWETFGPSQN